MQMVPTINNARLKIDLIGDLRLGGSIRCLLAVS